MAQELRVTNCPQLATPTAGSILFLTVPPQGKLTHIRRRPTLLSPSHVNNACPVNVLEGLQRHLANIPRGTRNCSAYDVERAFVSTVDHPNDCPWCEAILLASLDRYGID